jgi:hypothetical protein
MLSETLRGPWRSKEARSRPPLCCAAEVRAGLVEGQLCFEASRRESRTPACQAARRLAEAPGWRHDGWRVSRTARPSGEHGGRSGGGDGG